MPTEGCRKCPNISRSKTKKHHDKNVHSRRNSARYGHHHLLWKSVVYLGWHTDPIGCSAIVAAVLYLLLLVAAVGV